MVEVFGMGGEEVGVSRYRTNVGNQSTRHADLSPAQLERLDQRVHALLEEARQKAAVILRENRALVETLRDMLVEKKVIEAKSLQAMVETAKQ
jgi:cell division protease FtsH